MFRCRAEDGKTSPAASDAFQRSFARFAAQSAIMPCPEPLIEANDSSRGRAGESGECKDRNGWTDDEAGDAHEWLSNDVNWGREKTNAFDAGQDQA